MTKRKDTPGRRFLRSLKWAVPFALVAALVALAFVPKAIEVDVGRVITGPMTLTIDDDGEARVRERYTISAPLAGRLLRIGLKPGDEVIAGGVLATIDPGPPSLLDPRARAQAQALVGAAEAAVEQAKAQLEARTVDTAQLEKEYLRNKTLREKGNIADAVHEQSERAYFAARHAEDAAKSAVEVAAFELEQAGAALVRTEPPEEGVAAPEPWNFVIHSPVDGLVLRVHEESSRIVQAGAPLLEIGNPGDLELRIDVLSQDAVKIKPGQRVIIGHWGGDRPLEARVRLVEPSAYTKVSALGVDEQRVEVIADIDESGDGDSALGDGYRVEAQIVVWESEGILQVPAGALFRSGSKWAVYKADGDRARQVEIEIGRNNGDAAEVLSGLGDQERILLHPGDRIKDGSLINPRS